MRNRYVKTKEQRGLTGPVRSQSNSTLHRLGVAIQSFMRKVPFSQIICYFKGNSHKYHNKVSFLQLYWYCTQFLDYLRCKKFTSFSMIKVIAVTLGLSVDTQYGNPFNHIRFIIEREHYFLCACDFVVWLVLQRNRKIYYFVLLTSNSSKYFFVGGKSLWRYF